MLPQDKTYNDKNVVIRKQGNVCLFIVMILLSRDLRLVARDCSHPWPDVCQVNYLGTTLKVTLL